MNHIKYLTNSIKILLLVFYFLIIILFKLIRNQRIIIVSDQYGRLGNRLYLFSQFIIFCKKYNYELWIPGFYEYKSYFSDKNSLLCYQSTIDKYLFFVNEKDFYYSIVRIVNFFKSYKILNQITLSFQCDKEGNPWDRILSTKFPVVFFEGFIFDQFKLDTGSDMNLIKDFFYPVAAFQDNINKPIDSLKEDNDLVCGILIRQTDYRTWNNGKCFYTTQEYSQIIHKIASLLSNYKIGFFIATDEIQDENLFKGLNYIIRVGYPLENMYTLSKCDFLVGPPSSYIGWASYYGEKDLFTIENLIHFESNFQYFLNSKFSKYQ